MGYYKKMTMNQGNAQTALRTPHSSPFGGGLGWGQLRTAFTLIELLVVIAIISLLVSILLPSLTKAKELAKAVVCMNNEKSIGLAVQFYADDYDDVLAPSCMESPPNSGYFYEAHTLLAKHGYLDLIEAWTCPSLPDQGNVFCANQPRGGGYSVNHLHLHYCNLDWMGMSPVTRSSLTRAGAVLSFVECTDVKSYNYPPWPWPYYAICPVWDGINNHYWGSPATMNILSKRHDENNNVLFADGHVEPVKYDDILNSVNDIWGHDSR